MVTVIGRVLVVLLALVSGARLVASGDEVFELVEVHASLDDDRAQIASFLESEEGIEAHEIYRRGVQDGLCNYPIELPITKKNLVGFLALQKNVSPALRKAIARYLLAEDSHFVKALLQCLSVSNVYCDKKIYDIVISGPFRYFSPLFNEISFGGIEFQWAGKTFPEELLSFKGLTRLAFTQTHFVDAESFTLFDYCEEVLPQLQILSFHHCTIPEALGKHFKKMPKLTFLSLVDTKVEGCMGVFMKHLPQGLEILYLNHVGLTKAPKLDLSRLASLDISNNPMVYPKKLSGLVRYYCGLNGWYVRPQSDRKEVSSDSDLPELLSFERGTSVIESINREEVFSESDELA